MSKNNKDGNTHRDFAFPRAWTLFGPIGKDDPEPEFAGMNAVPMELAIAGKRLAAQPAAFTDNRLDLGALCGGKGDGKTAYLLATVEAAKEMEIELGAGADWWMKWWVNGEIVCDTMKSGNGNHPPSVPDHRFKTRLKAGRNLVAVKVVSGGGSFALAAGGPREIKELEEDARARETAWLAELAAAKREQEARDAERFGGAPRPVAPGVRPDEADYRAMAGYADLVYDRPVTRSVEGHPIGNGRMGSLVWTTPGTIEFQINRVDVFAVNRHTTGRHYANPDTATTDYCGGGGRISIGVGGEPFRAGPAFKQRLSLADARCTVSGEGVQAECWVAAADDLLVVQVTDEREAPQPIAVTLAMWREPDVHSGAHTAAYAFQDHGNGLAVVQSFREADHFCASALAIACPDAPGRTAAPEAKSRVLLLPAAAGTRLILIAGAAAWDRGEDAGATAWDLLEKAGSTEGLAGMKDRHAAWWRGFWQRTFIRLESPDGRAEQVARDRMRFLYHMAASSRGAWPPKWNGSIFAVDGDSRAWGSQFWLWTTEMLYWPLHAADASDLATPFFEIYRKALPAMATAARQRWNAAGIFLPETMPFDGPAELPTAIVEEYRDRFLVRPRGTAVSPTVRDRCLYDWHLDASTRTTDAAHAGHSWISHVASSGAELAVHAWWHYRCTGDRDWLESHAYPFLRGTAEFYRSLARRGDDGLWHLHGTNAHEDFWGVTDSIYDLAAIRGTVPLAIGAAEILETDAALRKDWQAFLDALAPYPLGADPRAKALTGGALADDAWAAGYRGLVDGSHNPEDVQLAPIFPFEDWTLETRHPAVDRVAQRTLALAPRHARVIGGETLNTAIRSPIAAVRAGLGAELPASLKCYRAAFAPLPNGFSLFEGAMAHSIEHLGLLTMTLQEALLQSVSPRPGEPEVISVFPAWPREWNAEFRLLARGGFMVSAASRGGEVRFVEIESRRGEECRLRNPWGEAAVALTRDGKPAGELRGGRLRFATKKGEVVALTPRE